jgi:MFS family permease
MASMIAAGGRGLGVLITWVPIYLQNGLGLDPGYSGILFTLLLVGSVVGPLMLGRISDQHGRRPLLLAAYVAATALTIFFTTLDGKSPWMPLTLLAMGVVVYSESPLLQAALADSTEGLDRDFTFALYYTATFGMGALWASTLGWVIDTYGYTMGFYIMTASYIVSAFAVLPIHDARIVREK